MFEELTGSAFTFLDDFVTRMITSTFVTGDAPYVIDYSATARFNPFSTVFLSQEQLDEALTIAFTGENLDAYTALLKDLPAENVFNDAQVFFGEATVRTAQRSENSNAAAIAAAAVAATMFAAGIVLYKRRRQAEEYSSTDLDKKGDHTVAGETFSGYSYDGSASANESLGRGSRYRDGDDEESAKKTRDVLGTIEEVEDDNASRPPWGAAKETTYDDDETSVPSKPFDQMALQGLATNSRNSGFSADKRRPRTVEEIEAMLCTEKNDDDASLAVSTRARSFGNDSSSASSPSQRPRTVEEIESLLSEGVDCDSIKDELD